MMFELPSDEGWRIVTGSLIHSRVAHWLSNFVMSIAIAAACGPVLRYYFLPIFFVGGVASFALTLAWNGYFPSQNDGLVGTSGGMAALLGSHLILCVKNLQSFPKQFFLTILYFVLISLIVGAIFLSSTSLACHAFGLIAGALIGLLVPNYLALPEKENQGTA